MYRAETFEHIASNVYFNCVSNSQAASFADLPRFLGVVQNGIALDRFPPQRAKGDYLLWIGRICEEKGPHLAIDVAQRAGLPLTMAGTVYPFSYHQQFFAREIAPRLSSVNYIDSPSFDEKLKLLQNARAVLLTSTVNETSSLVAMEAMACGTPVVAFRRGAFPEVVADGVTGFICDDLDAMADGVSRVHEIDPVACRRRVEKFFSSKGMALDYERLYHVLTSETRQQKTDTISDLTVPDSAA
jgi:glycosyltransferase involved in cell wall biosynthesis